MELEMEFIRKMPSPQELKVDHPVEPAIYEPNGAGTLRSGTSSPGKTAAFC